jgi:activator of HSP90 ATPase
MSTAIHHEVVVPDRPDDVYETLLDGARFARVTGAPAEIDRGAGGAFSCFGGMIVGRQVELVPGRRIVQAWRAGNWSPGVYSIVRFDLEADAGGTRIVFDHTGFPDAERDHLEAGWWRHYWGPLRGRAD